MPETDVKPEEKDGKQPAGDAAGGSATEKKEVPPAGAAGSSGTEKRTDSRELEKKTAFFEKRQERKHSLEDKIAMLQQEMQTLKASRTPSASDGRKSILEAEDPDAYLDGRFDGLKQDIDEIKSFKQALEGERRSALRNQADEYLLSRKHLEDPLFSEEIRNRLHTDPSLVAMSEFDPMRAAKAAYMETCEAKGVTPDFAAPSLAGRASGPRPTITRSVTVEERSFAGWKAYLGAAQKGTEEYDKRRAEMQKASDEGKIK